MNAPDERLQQGEDRGIGVFNRQAVFPVPEAFLQRLGEWSRQAWRGVLARARVPVGLIGEDLEITLLDDSAIARVHLDYLKIPGATDVITFEHGEILISLETAERQAAEFGDSFEREVLRYIVHGMLHLAGYDDRDPESRAAMEAVQEELVAAIFPDDRETV